LPLAQREHSRRAAAARGGQRDAKKLYFAKTSTGVEVKVIKIAA